MERSLKFNVDGSTRGKSDLAGCASVLRDVGVRVLAMFSGLLRVMDSKRRSLRGGCGVCGAVFGKIMSSVVIC
ncbi:hypothetical protein GQ457_14G016500 [Hibiscus cannabinus]